jgi:ankyrin repeat protein
MQEIARLHDNAPRDDSSTPSGCELNGISASGSAKQHNGNVYNNSEHCTSFGNSTVTFAKGGPRHVVSIHSSRAKIRRLLDLHADVDYRDQDGLTALHHAIFGGFEDAVQLLLDRGADTNASSPNAATPLHLAVLKGRSNIAELLIGKYRAAVNTIDPDFGTPLHCAAFAGDVKVAETLLKHGAQIDSMCAVSSSKLKWLSSSSLGDKAPSESTSDSPFTHATPLLGAILSKQELMTKFLIQSGASTNQPSKISIKGFSEHRPASLYPIHVVATRGLSDLLAHLLANKTNPDAQDYFGHTALIHACSAGNVGIALQLLEAGASPDVINYKGETALHAAAREGHVECVRALCSHGATINIVNSDGETPLQLAQKASNSAATAKILLASQNRTNATTAIAV